MCCTSCCSALRIMYPRHSGSPFFFFNDTATTEIYTLSLHDALPIYAVVADHRIEQAADQAGATRQTAREATQQAAVATDRKSTRLNSSHLVISYAVFCLKKKKKHDGII